MRSLAIATIGYLVILPLTAWIFVWQQSADKALLHVSYDPTRELWRDINKEFREKHERETGIRIAINQSHGASGSQARAVIDGLDADVVSLALWSDTDQLRKSGLLKTGWDNAGNQTLPYTSTIVFVVRVDGRFQIRDWDDLIRGDVSVIIPNPKTSGNGKLAFLAAWGAVLAKPGSTEADAERYVAELFRRVPVLDTGARGAAMTFAQKNIGDVHLTWENEAHLEVKESQGKLKLIYPPISIKAEPHVAMVDANVDRRGTRDVVARYIEFIHSDEGQKIVARHFYRPANDRFRDKNVLPDLTLFDLSPRVARNWDEAQRKFFADGGVFDRIYQKK